MTSPAELKVSSDAAEQKTAKMHPQLSSLLKTLTPARIGLRRSGVSLQTSEILDFQVAHARARDAVHAPLDVASLLADLRTTGLVEPDNTDEGIFHLHSQAADRRTYLQRPDFGRRLNQASRERLQKGFQNKEDAELQAPSRSAYKLSLVIADGLSALAVQRHAAPFLTALFSLLKAAEPRPSIAPICVVEQGRVAIGDEIGKLLSAEMVIILIGERPGLSSPDSLGIYITWLRGSERTITDAERNCISNVRLEGLSYVDAAARLWHYIQEARRSEFTGVLLKDPEPSEKALHRGDD